MSESRGCVRVRRRARRERARGERVLPEVDAARRGVRGFSRLAQGRAAAPGHRVHDFGRRDHLRPHGRGLHGGAGVHRDARHVPRGHGHAHVRRADRARVRHGAAQGQHVCEHAHAAVRLRRARGVPRARGARVRVQRGGRGPQRARGRAARRARPVRAVRGHGRAARGPGRVQRPLWLRPCCVRHDHAGHHNGNHDLHVCCRHECVPLPRHYYGPLLCRLLRTRRFPRRGERPLHVLWHRHWHVLLRPVQRRYVFNGLPCLGFHLELLLLLLGVGHVECAHVVRLHVRWLLHGLQARLPHLLALLDHQWCDLLRDSKSIRC